MRLATLVVAASMLLAVGTSLATHSQEERVHHEHPYTGEIEVEDDAYVKPGWWKGEPMAPTGPDDGGFAVNLTAMEAEGGQHAHWLWIKETDDEVTSTVNIDVEASGAVVAAMDVFKMYQDGTGPTPDCPQRLVEDLYPDEERVSWAFRVFSEATTFHQRGTQDSAMSASLTMDDVSRGYLVAIYPQAASGNEQVVSAAGEANISYEVSFNEPDKEIWVLGDQEGKAPDRPFHTDEWVRLPGISPTVECVDRGIALPDELTESEAIQELPGADPADEQVLSLLETSLD